MIPFTHAHIVRTHVSNLWHTHTHTHTYARARAHTQCGPCRVFTPELVETYNIIRMAGKSFQIIFVSSDRDEESMKEYMADMPWLAIPFGDPRKKVLSRLFKVEGKEED